MDGFNVDYGYLMNTGLTNSLFVIFPYYYEGTWAFDDSMVGLVREPFVCGIPEMIERLVANIPNARTGFKLVFSSKPFPGFSARLIWARQEDEGNWYYSEQYDSEGWLCPALYKYFASAPKEIYVKAEPK